jgi:metallo-beta-lactamase family protein
MGSKERFFCEITSLNPEVTGSCHLVTVHYPDGRQTNFIVDCGMFQGETEYVELNNRQFPFKAEHIEFCLITHNHADHMGRLCYLVKSGFRGNIYATYDTADAMNLALVDSFKIMREDARKKKIKPLYDEEHLDRTLAKIEPCKFEEVEYLDRNIKATFFMNGHLLGAAIILVQISYPGENDINILFTGDYKPYNLFFNMKDMPEWVYQLPLTLVTEATYGYKDTYEVEYKMEADVENAIKSGKTILISVLAQGRAQEVLYMLQNLQKRGKISKEIPIGLDGNLAQRYTGFYQRNRLIKSAGKDDFLPENFSFITKENRMEILNSKKQQIILTTSGMMDNGPAQIYLDAMVGRKDVLIYIPSYAAPGTLANKLLNPEGEDIQIMGKKRKYIAARINTTSEFSSHAKADELIDFLQMFERLNLVLINHGQTEVKQMFAERVEREVKTKRVEILGEHTFRFCHHGYMKHMGAKLIFPENSETKHAKKEKKDKRFKLSFVRKNRKR